MKSKISIAEQKGAEAITALQALVGIIESPEKALAGWRGMSSGEKQSTLQAHAIMCGSK